MNTREFLIGCFKAERPKFERVLRAVPPDKLAYRPHPRSSCAGEIVWLLASELSDACVIVDRGEIDFVLPPAPATLDESIAAYERKVSLRCHPPSGPALDLPAADGREGTVDLRTFGGRLGSLTGRR
jgi:hypothetical protein